MGARQEKFQKCLIDNDIDVLKKISIERNKIVTSSYDTIVKKVYKDLGGILPEYPINFGPFDIITNTCFIELDEENHFQRYRSITLKSSIYNDYDGFTNDNYLDFCNDYENNARDDRGYWTNKSCEKQFGQSAPNGVLTGNGSARWKQRAFYDFLKDVYALIIDKPLYRFSIYENFKGQTVNDLLMPYGNDEILFQFIKKRIGENI